jgi:vancomycin permeability regulator SanA
VIIVRRILLRLRRMALPLTVLAGLVLYALAAPTAWAYVSTARYRMPAARVPAEPVGIVLGAGLDSKGRPTPFLVARLETAARLYRMGKIRVFLVTGDNSRTDYDEPTAMLDYLVTADRIPAEKIVRDYAGFDTWASCDRARKVFGVSRAIVVTQDFHLPRAVALCRAAGITAFGVGQNSMTMDSRVTAFGYFREVFATMKAMATLTTHPRPRFLGPRDDGVRRALAVPDSPRPDSP